MLHGTNSKISDVPPCPDLTDLDIFHVALIVDRSDRSVSSPCSCFRFIFRDDWIERVKRQTCLMQPRVYVNWGQTSPAIVGVSCWNARERWHHSLNLTVILHWIMVSRRLLKALDIKKFSSKISIHRHMKEPHFPNGRIFVCNTQDEWLIYRDFLILHYEDETVNTEMLDFSVL